MTREEAIAYAKKELKAAYERAKKVGHKGKTRYIEILEMSISVLEQEPCEDAVSREDAIKALQKVACYSAAIRARMIGAIEDLPSVTQKPIECDDAISREDAEQMFRNIRSHLKPQDYKSAEEFNTRDLMLLNAEQMIHALPSVTQKSGKCKNCKYFEYDSVAKVDGIPLIVAHEICNKWGDGCKTSEDGYCYLFEPQESEVRNDVLCNRQANGKRADI